MLEEKTKGTAEDSKKYITGPPMEKGKVFKQVLGIAARRTRDSPLDSPGSASEKLVAEEQRFMTLARAVGRGDQNTMRKLYNKWDRASNYLEIIGSSVKLISSGGLLQGL